MRVYQLLLLASILTIVGGGSGTAFAQAMPNEELCVGFPTAGPKAGVPTSGRLQSWR